MFDVVFVAVIFFAVAVDDFLINIFFIIYLFTLIFVFRGVLFCMFFGGWRLGVGDGVGWGLLFVLGDRGGFRLIVDVNVYLFLCS